MKVTVNIIGTGQFLPGAPIPNSEIESIFGSPEHIISRQLGVQTRHWAIDLKTGEPFMKNSDMAAEAAKKALKDAGVSANEINLLVLSTFTPDYPIPNTLTFIQEKLEIENDCSHIELRAGCAGAIQALRVAADYLFRHPSHTALVIGCDFMSPFLIQGFLNEDIKEIKMYDRVNALMYGDGAGAVVLKANMNYGIEIIDSHYGCKGNRKEPGFIQLAGGSAIPLNEKVLKAGLHRFKHNYKTVAKEGIGLVLFALERIFRSQQIDVNTIDKIYIHAPYATLYRAIDELFKINLAEIEKILHQYIDGEFLIKQIAQLKKKEGELWEKVKKKIFLNTHIVGNTGSAGPFIAIDEINKKKIVKEHHSFIIIVVEATKWIYSGMVFKQLR